MSKFILRAPDADKRHLEDYRHHWQEHSYTETVDVIDGIARCNDETTKHMLTGLGYVLIDPSRICECGYIALSDEESSQHEEECAKARKVAMARKADEIEAERKADEIEVKRKADEIEAERAEVKVDRKTERARKASEAHVARMARKEAHRARKVARHEGFELIKSRLVCGDCGHVCMVEEEFAEHIKTCPERKPRL